MNRKQINELRRQLDADWEIDADEAGLDKEDQENIIKMVNKMYEKSRKEDERVRNLETENSKLKEALEGYKESLKSDLANAVENQQTQNNETFNSGREAALIYSLEMLEKHLQTALQSTKNKEA